MAKYALCIGINNYPGTQNDLSGCVNDADDWAKELTSRGFTVTTLLDGKATKAAMVEGMQAVIGRAKYGDAVVITYSGHGTWVADEDGDEPDKRDEALCPHDMASGPLVDDQLYEIFAERERGVRLVLVADSCHSGTVARFHREAAEPRRVRFLAPEDYPQNKDKLKRLRLIERAPARGRSRGGALLLAGCQDTEYSYDASFHGKANGAFTRVALDELKKLPKAASYSAWFKAIRLKLPSTSYPQTPNMIATSSQKKWPVLESQKVDD
jgi:metacaspase-1